MPPLPKSNGIIESRSSHRSFNDVLPLNVLPQRVSIIRPVSAPDTASHALLEERVATVVMTRYMADYKFDPAQTNMDVVVEYNDATDGATQSNIAAAQGAKVRNNKAAGKGTRQKNKACIVM